MALNFELLGDAGAPVTNYLQGQQDVVRNQLAQQQFETGRIGQETSRLTQDKMRMEMDAFKRRQAGLDQFMQKAKELGVDGDPEQLTKAFYDHALSTGDPEQVQAARIAVQTARERKNYEAGLDPVAATPTPSGNFANFPNAREIAPGAAPMVPRAAGPVDLAPAAQGEAGAPVLTGNALTPTPNRLAQIDKRLLELRRFPTAGEKERADLVKERDRLMTPYVVGKNLISGSGAPLYTTPVEPTAPKLHVVGKNLVDETGKVVFKAQPEPGASVPKAPAGYRVTATGDLEAIPGGPAANKPLTEAQAIKRRDTVGKEFKSATSALQTTQDVLDSIAFVKAEPGLARATGFTGMLPSFPEGGAASAEVRLANLKGKVTALGKAAAAASGNIGSIATVEWKILSDQIAAIDPVKGTGPLLAQLDLVEQQAQGAMSRIRDGYERQFGEDFERFPQFSDLPPPKSAVKPKTPEAPNKPTATQGTGGFKYLGKVGGN